MSASTHSCLSPFPDELYASFLELLPRIELHARIHFRDVRCPGQRADKVQETVALAWQWFVRLHQRGKDVARFPMVFVYLVARAVRSGRRLCGQERAKDVLSPAAPRRHGFRVEALPSSLQASCEGRYARPHGQEVQDAFEERLRDNHRTPPPDAAAFRIDFPAWLCTLAARERRIVRAMARNERTGDLSRQFGVSPGRVSQLRREFHRAWLHFHGENATPTQRTATP